MDIDSFLFFFGIPILSAIVGVIFMILFLTASQDSKRRKGFMITMFVFYGLAFLLLLVALGFMALLLLAVSHM